LSKNKIVICLKDSQNQTEAEKQVIEKLNKMKVEYYLVNFAGKDS